MPYFKSNGLVGERYIDTVVESNGDSYSYGGALQRELKAGLNDFKDRINQLTSSVNDY